MNLSLTPLRGARYSKLTVETLYFYKNNLSAIINTSLDPDGGLVISDWIY